MVRRHGWQLPAHTLQVAAITVFFLLAVAYYIFLAPFLWMTSLEDTAYALYTPLALAVFLLYVRCTAINPADPGVLGNPHHYKHYRKESSELSAGITPEPAGVPLSIHNSSPSSVTSSVKEFNMKASSLEEGHQGRHKTSNMCSCGLCGLCCGWMVIPDDSCRSKPPVDEENVLFCTLCNAEVRKFSKHCRSCDKCVDGFDHHCRWLNNCIGTKNYRTFVALMTTSLLLLTLEWGVGIAVFVRCFVDKHGTEAQISQKLGNGFTRAPFATVVAVCTLVAMLASFPLFELFFFHLILIKKGITTYEYVVAVRAQPGELTGDLEQSGMSSTSSSTVVSRSSSVGLRQHGGLCTPPRVFTVEHQDEVDPPSVDPPSASRMTSSTIHPDRPNGLHKKRGNVRISAWRLAKLNAEDAAVAAAKAREASSVLRPLGHPDLRGLSDSDESLSSNGSQPSSMSTDFGLPMGLGRGREDVKATMSLSPYKLELPRIRTGREQGDPVPWSERAPAPGTDPNSSSSRISTSVATTLPSSLSGTPFLVELPRASSSRLHSIPGPTTGARPSSSTPLVGPSSMRINIRGGSVLDPAAAAERAKVMGVISDGYDPSSGETTDDVAAPSLKGKLPLGSGMKLSTMDSKSPPVFWNRGTGRSGGGRPSRTIEFGGRGISTSILSAHESRRQNWRDSLSSPSSQSDPDQATPEHAQYSTTPSPSTASHPSPNVPAIARLPPHVQISSPSIFYSGPLMPIGESSGSRPQQLPPRPPGALMKSGMPKHSGVGSSSRSFSTRASAQPFQTPVFVPRNSNRPRS